MHPCSELPPYDEDKPRLSRIPDKTCLDRIKASYVTLNDTQFSGAGRVGSVVLLDDRSENKAGHLIAVKVMPYFIIDLDRHKNVEYQNQIMQDATDELRIACGLNSLAGETTCFIKTYGWLLCSHVPEEWAQLPGFQLHPHARTRTLLYMFMFMDRGRYKFMANNIAVRPDEAMCFFFLLSHALYVARRRLGFSHNDLHRDNIMIESTKEEQATQRIVIGEREYVIALPAGRYPKIIDFGQSTTTELAKSADRKRNDFKFLHDAFAERFPGMFSDDWCETHAELVQGRDDGRNSAVVEQFLLNDPMFEELRAHQPAAQKRTTRTAPPVLILDRCTFCGSPARMKWDTVPHMRFCTVFCAHKVAGIASFMPNH